MTRFAVCLSFLFFATTVAIAAAPEPPEFREAHSKYTELAEQEKYGEAIPYAKKALDIALKSPAFDDATRGRLAFNLGYGNFLDWHLSDSIAAFTIAIERLEKATKPDRGLLAEVLLYRGRCYRALYRNSEAEADLRKAIGMLTDPAPAVQIMRADALENLAWVMIQRRETGEARGHAADARRIYTTLLSERHPRVLRSLILAAAIEYVNGRRSTARSILAGAAAAAEKAGLTPEGATEKTTPDQFSPEELAWFHSEMAHFYALMQREKDVEYHRKLAADLRRGKRPAVLRVKPVDRRPPNYPHRAMHDGREGWALVQYTVRKDGSTADIEIIEAAPEGYFERAAITAVKLWKYEPPLEDGKPAEVKGVRTMIQFSMENGPPHRTGSRVRL